MPTHHDDITLTAGDDWVIGGSITDENGDPLDLAQITMLQWVLLGPDGLPVLPPGSVVVQIIDPPADGLVAIKVPSSVTKMLNPARYVDAMRVVMSQNAKSSVWQGIINVDANPFDVTDNMVPVDLIAGPDLLGAPEIGVSDLAEVPT